MYYLHYLCFLCIVVSNTYCVVCFFLLCTLCYQFLWIVQFWLSVRYFLTFFFHLTKNAQWSLINVRYVSIYISKGVFHIYISHSILQIVLCTERHMAVYGSVRHQKNIIWTEASEANRENKNVKYNICP